CLIGIIDDADGEIIYGQFTHWETTLSCMAALKKVIEERGLFKILYVDKAGLFGGKKREGFSHVKKALSDLGIEIIFAHSPQAKGRIERAFKTLQDRLIPELRLNKIRTTE